MSKIQGSMFFFTHLHTSIFQITIISTERFALGKNFGCNAFWKRKGVEFCCNYDYNRMGVGGGQSNYLDLYNLPKCESFGN